MTRVSENSKNNILNYNLSRAKEKLEGLQFKGSTLKRIARPSDDPAGNVDLLALRSRLADNGQFLRNLNYAKTHLEFTENALSDLSDIFVRAKEISIAQSSDTFSPEVRENVAEEVDQLFQQLITIGNQRVGHKYLFAGYATHRRPFDSEGRYWGDDGRTFIEVKKDFFAPINLTGAEIFLGDNGEARLFDLLKGLRHSLRTGSSEGVQNLLEGLDQAFSRLVNLRSRVGAIYHSVISAQSTIARDNVTHAAHGSEIEDADVVNLFSELEKQNNILQAVYKSGASLVNGSLLDFLKS